MKPVVQDEMLWANESQGKKIEFLTQEKDNAELYIQELEEILKINKQSLSILNQEGTNNPLINKLNEENLLLQDQLVKKVREVSKINALRLFEAQIRTQEKEFYQ